MESSNGRYFGFSGQREREKYFCFTTSNTELRFISSCQTNETNSLQRDLEKAST